MLAMQCNAMQCSIAISGELRPGSKILANFQSIFSKSHLKRQLRIKERWTDTEYQMKLKYFIFTWPHDSWRPLSLKNQKWQFPLFAESANAFNARGKEKSENFLHWLMFCRKIIKIWTFLSINRISKQFRVCQTSTKQCSIRS